MCKSVVHTASPEQHAIALNDHLAVRARACEHYMKLGRFLTRHSSWFSDGVYFTFPAWCLRRDGLQSVSELSTKIKLIQSVFPNQILADER